jgi:hypothetical protein
MKPRFQADADFNVTILSALVRREPAIDIQTAATAGLKGRPDPEVLALAADEGRTLLTHDHKTMPRHFGAFIGRRESPGVLVVPQHLPVSAAVEELLLVWGATDASEWINRIAYLPL